MNYEKHCKQILDLFRATGKDVPHENSNMGRAVRILQTICDSQSHSIPDFSGLYKGVPLQELRERQPDHEILNDVESDCADIFEAIEELETMIHESNHDYHFEFDGSYYRLIESSEENIWPIYCDEIEELVKDCYSIVLKLDEIPDFIAVSIDWEQTARNAYADGYGHHFSGYDGSEEEVAGFYIFRTN